MCVCDGSPSSSDVIRLEGEEVALEEKEEDCHQRSLLHNLDGPKFACWMRRRRTKCAIISSLPVSFCMPHDKCNLLVIVN